MQAKGRSPTSAIAPPASIENHAAGQSPSRISMKLLGCQQSQIVSGDFDRVTAHPEHADAFLFECACQPHPAVLICLASRAAWRKSYDEELGTPRRKSHWLQTAIERYSRKHL